MAAAATPAELEDIAALLRLLRDGSAPLKALLSAARAEQQEVAKPAMGATAPQRKQKPAVGRSGGWQTVEAKKKPALAGKEKDTLLAGEFSVPVVENTAAFQHAAPAVCLGSITETDRALLELKPAVPQAVLCPVKRHEAATEVWVVVKDGQGKEQARKRFLHQLCSQPVVHTSSAKRGGQTTDTSVLVVLSVSQKHSGDQKWKQMKEKPKSLIADWLKNEVGAKEILEIRTPSITAGTMQAVVRVDKSHLGKVLTQSGRGGIFSRPWYEKQETPPGTVPVREFRSVPIPLEQDLASSLRTATARGEEVLGVVPFGPGFALRVRTANYEKVLGEEQKKDASLRFKGSKYEVKGLPLSWGAAQIKEFLGDWDATPLHGTRHGYSKTWVVTAETAPFSRKLQHDFGLAMISEYQKKEEARPKQMWVGSKGKGRSSGPKPGGPRSPSGAWNRPARPTPAVQKPRAQELDEKDEEMQEAATEANPHLPAQQADGLQAGGGVNLPEDFISRLMAKMEEIAARTVMQAKEAAEKAALAAIAPFTEEMRARKLARREAEEETDDERTEEDKLRPVKSGGKGSTPAPPAPPSSRRSIRSVSVPPRSRSPAAKQK